MSFCIVLLYVEINDMKNEMKGKGTPTKVKPTGFKIIKILQYQPNSLPCMRCSPVSLASNHTPPLAGAGTVAAHCWSSP